MGASGAAYALTSAYVFTPVTGSPFFAGGHQVAFSPDGAHLADVSAQSIYIQSVSKAGLLGEPVGAAGVETCPPRSPSVPINTGRFDSIAYSTDGKLLAAAEEPGSGIAKGNLRIFKVSGTKLTQLSCQSLPYVSNFFHFGNSAPERFYSVAFGPANLLAVANEAKNTVTIYSVSAEGVTHAAYSTPFATGKDPDSVAFGPTRSGGEALVVANWGDNSISLFTDSSNNIAPAAGSPQATLAHPMSVAFSPSGGLMAVAGGPGSGLVWTYSVGFTAGVSGTGAGPLPEFGESAAFSANGSLLAVADGADITIFSVAESGLLSNITGSPVTPAGNPGSVAFDADGFIMAAATGKTAVYTYGPAYAVPVPLPAWLSARVALALGAVGMAAESAHIDQAISAALAQVHWSSSAPIATIRISALARPRRAGRRRVSVLALRLNRDRERAHVISHHHLPPGLHTVLISATASGRLSAPQPLQVTVVR